MQEIILFYQGLDVPTRQQLDSKGVVPQMSAVNAKKAIQEAADHSQKWHDGTSTRSKSITNFDGFAAIQAQLDKLSREIKKRDERAYAAQVGCEKSPGPHYTNDCPSKNEETFEEAYYTQFGQPFQLQEDLGKLFQVTIKGTMEIPRIKKGGKLWMRH